VQPVTVPADQPLNLDINLNAGFVTSVGRIEGGGQETGGRAWKIRKKSTVEGEEGERVDTQYTQTPRFVLPAGDYVMTLSKDRAEAVKEFTVAAGDSINLDMSIDIGRITPSALYAPGGPPVKAMDSWKLHKPPGIEGGEGERVDTQYSDTPNFGVPAGKYKLTATKGRASMTIDVEIQSGGAVKPEIVMNAGIVGFKGPPTESIKIVGAAKDIEGNRKRFQTFYNDEGNLALPAGDYVAIADFGDGVEKEFTFTIKAGERTEIEIKQ
jgi:Ca-activated chloride channel homolog